LGRNQRKIFETSRKIKKDLISKSKFLSLILRHNPSAGNITLDNEGWALVKDLIHNAGFAKEELKIIVETDSKQRYSFDKSGNKIRANQGHSLYSVKINYEKVVPPEFLYHGTVMKSIDNIFKEGLKKQKRNYLHLSDDIKTATSVGSRRGNPIILKIRALDMYNDVYKFYISENGIYLTDFVPPSYISIDWSVKFNKQKF